MTWGNSHVNKLNKNNMKPQDLKNKKITLATLKSFIKHAPELYVICHSSFSGMSDMVEQNDNPHLIPVAKEDAIGLKGAYCVGSSRDIFEYTETETHYGIRVCNCCGSDSLLTPKVFESAETPTLRKEMTIKEFINLNK